MTSSLILADVQTEYEVQEAGVLVFALGFVIALGGIAAAAVVICGWRGAKSVALDWLKGRATFVCR